MSKRVKSTSDQRESLRQCHPGVGFCVYHAGDGSTIEFEFCIDHNGQMRYIANGQPVAFDVREETAQTKGA